MTLRVPDGTYLAASSTSTMTIYHIAVVLVLYARVFTIGVMSTEHGFTSNSRNDLESSTNDLTRAEDRRRTE